MMGINMNIQDHIIWSEIQNADKDVEDLIAQMQSLLASSMDNAQNTEQFCALEYLFSYSGYELNKTIQLAKVIMSFPAIAYKCNQENIDFALWLITNQPAEAIYILNQIEWNFSRHNSKGLLLSHSFALADDSSWELVAQIIKSKPNLANANNLLGDSPLEYALTINNVAAAELLFNCNALLPLAPKDTWPAQARVWLNDAYIQQKTSLKFDGLVTQNNVISQQINPPQKKSRRL
jgi:hypothetical protein